ncbi:MAG: aldehyde dehydrogenase family protein [Deltaproteobacteria bacterium]|nr:aldehyde dehydrogenase family protein [Deltaproteobacteria bacterium]
MALLSEVSKHYGRLKFFIDGKWVDSKSTTINQTTNPAIGEVIAEFPTATQEEADAAVEAAYRAFKTWSNLPLRDRARLLFDLRGKFDEYFDELSRVLTQDHGRTIDESRGSVRRVIENIESACSALYRLARENEHVDQLARGIDEYLVWEPVGVFLIITPGNIPMHAWSSFVPYALACGCPVVWSPSWQGPVCANKITEVVEEAGFPPGVHNLIHVGNQVELNATMFAHPYVQGAGFIGSTAVSKILFDQAGKLGKRTSLNGNGKNHIVIMPDADIDRGIEYLLRGCYGMTGQRCLGTDNVVIVGDVYDEVKSKFVEASAGMKLGYGLDEDTDLGPMTTQMGKEKVLQWIEKGLKEGAKIALDGREVKVKDYPNGYFLGPTILGDVHPDMHIAKEEAFGPVANLIRASNLDEAIEWINTKTNLGHSACILTADGKNARKFTREVNVGNVGVNLGIPQPYSFFPMASKRESFFGNAHSRMDSVRLFMDQKTVTLRWV